MNKKQILDFEEYFITPEGHVTHNDQPLKIQITKRGMPFVRLRKDNKYYTFAIAKLVAMTFLPEGRKSPSDIVCYLDGNNHNFNVTNLKWASRSEAYSKMYDKDSRYSEKRLKHLRKSICRPVAKLSKDDRGDLFIVNEYSSVKDAADSVGVAPASLIRCLKNQNYMSAGYYWKYLPREVNHEESLG